MLRRALSRLIHAAIVILGVTVAVFFLLRLGDDPAGLLLPPDASPADIAAFRHQIGFDQPLPT